jgi:hypothetical protein
VSVAGRARPLTWADPAQTGDPWPRRPAWLSPTSLIIALATLLALGLRLWQFTRAGSLTGIVEYDDGPYVGSAILLTHGVLPYRDYIFVQPPGITLIMFPVALLARLGWTGTTAVMATGRILTALASTAGVPLVGLLVRRRGVAAVTIGCGLLAVYSGSIEASHTVLLEPWLALLCLLGALIVISDGKLTASRRRLCWGGVVFGLAGAVELWAVLPAAVITLLCLPDWRRAARFCAGAGAGFCLPVAPFFLFSPHGFYQGVITAQIGHRPGAVRVSPLYRFKLMSGLDWVHPLSGGLTVIAALVLGGTVICATLLAWVLASGPLAPLDVFALAVAGGLVVMFLIPSQFHYHFTGFLAPFLAMSVALPVATCARAADELLPATTRRWAQRLVGGLSALVIGIFGVIQAGTLTGLPPYLRVSPAVERLIPPRSCVLSDTSPVLILANRLTSNVPGCVPLLDSVGADLALSHGLRPDTGAGRVRSVEVMWWRAFRHAQFVWLKNNSQASPRVPWTSKLYAYFRRHFTLIFRENASYTGLNEVYGLANGFQIYARDGLDGAKS